MNNAGSLFALVSLVKDLGDTKSSRAGGIAQLWMTTLRPVAEKGLGHGSLPPG
jgi:hypothetical protein